MVPDFYPRDTRRSQPDERDEPMIKRIFSSTVCSKSPRSARSMPPDSHRSEQVVIVRRFSSVRSRDRRDSREPSRAPDDSDVERHEGVPITATSSKSARSTAPEDSDGARRELASKKRFKSTSVRVGDWVCPGCGITNWAVKGFCSRRDPPCLAPRDKDFNANRSDWICDCGNLNYPHHVTCNRERCGLPMF